MLRDIPIGVSGLRRSLRLGCLAGVLYWAAGAQAQIRLLSEEFPPVNFTRDGHPAGIAVDVVHEIQRRQGRIDPIEFLPWSRAYQIAQDPDPVAIFTMIKSPDRARRFKWVGPIVSYYTAFFAPSTSTVDVRSLDAARRATRILVVRNSYSAQQLESLGFRNLELAPDTTSATQMLLARRAPLYAAARIDSVESAPADGSIKTLFNYQSAQGYIAFSLATPDRVVEDWSARLREMKTDGSFAMIYHRWLPKDKAPD